MFNLYHILKSTLAYTAKNDVRYYLQSVHFYNKANGDLRIEASDGSTLIYYDIKHTVKNNAECPIRWHSKTDIMIKGESLKKHLSLFNAKSELRLNLLNDDEIELNTYKLDTECKNTKYPNVERVLGTYKGTPDATRIGFDFQIMAKAIKAIHKDLAKCGEFNFYRDTGTLIHFNDSNKDDYFEAGIVVMQCRL